MMICKRLDQSDKNKEIIIENEKIKLLRKLLNIVIMESLDIEDGTLGKLGEYSSVKKMIIEEVDKSNCCETDQLQSDEIEDLIKEIQDINEKNAKALVSLREKIKDELSAIHKSKQTHNAYIANAIANELNEH